MTHNPSDYPVRHLFSPAGILLLALVCIMAIVVPRCSNPVAGTTDETETRVGMNGHVVEPDGTGAAGATIRFYTPNASSAAKRSAVLPAGPIQPVKTVRADSTGYFLCSLALGTYNLEIAYADGPDSLYALRSGIVFKDSILQLGTHTVRRPGTMKGKLFASQSVSGITCYIPGTSHAWITDTSGAYRLDNVPYGTYTIAFTGSRFFADTAVNGNKVLPGFETNIPDVELRFDPAQNKYQVFGNFLETHINAVSKVITILSGSVSTPPSIAATAWDPATGYYSGYIITPSEGDIWSVMICVYDTSKRLTGKTVVKLERTNGTLPVPAFNPYNAFPVVKTTADTLCSIKDTIRLKATAIDDTLGGKIVRCQWRIPPSDSFITVSGTDTFIVAPNSPDTLRYVFRAIDNDSNTVTDTLTAFINAFKPVLSAITDSIYTAGDSATVSVNAVTRSGVISKYFWDVGATGRLDSTDQPSYTIVPRPKGIISLVWGARNDDGFITWATANLIFNQAPSSIQILKPDFSDTVSFKQFDYAASKGDVGIILAANDPDNRASELFYRFYCSTSSTRDSMKVMYWGSEPAFVISGLENSQRYYCYAVVVDKTGDSLTTMVRQWYFHTPGIPVPTQPSTLQARAVGTSYITLQWGMSSGADYYEILRSESPLGNFQRIDTTGTLTFTDTGLTINRTYYYKVAGINHSGISVYSNTCNTRTHIANDSLVVAYGLSPAQESQYRADGLVSPFWSIWGNLDTTSMSYLDLTASGNGWTEGTGQFSSDQDAELLVKIAYGMQGVYLLLEVRDDDFKTLPYKANTDVAKVFLDKISSQRIKTSDPYDLFPLFSLSYTFTNYSIEYKVPAGAPSLYPVYADFFLNSAITNTPIDSVSLRQPRFNGLMFDLIPVNATSRIQEWFIPWSGIGAFGGIGTMPALGTKIAFSIGYDDYDAGDNGTTSLGWKQRDPLSAPRDSSSFNQTNAWGDIEFGSALP